MEWSTVYIVQCKGMLFELELISLCTFSIQTSLTMHSGREREREGEM